MSGLDRDRLAKVLGRLGSAFDGERANAGKLAAELVRTSGSTWPELLETNSALAHELEIAKSACAALLAENERLRTAPPAAGDWQPVDRCRCHQCRAEECLQRPWRLYDREPAFLRSIARQRRRPSPKQSAWLAKICLRLGID